NPDRPRRERFDGLPGLPIGVLPEEGLKGAGSPIPKAALDTGLVFGVLDQPSGHLAGLAGHPVWGAASAPAGVTRLPRLKPGAAWPLFSACCFQEGLAVGVGHSNLARRVGHAPTRAM